MQMLAGDSVLREVRAQVAPEIPVLAPTLGLNPFAIHDAVTSAMQERGFNPSAFPEIDINKTERHTIAAFAISLMRQELVEGQGYEARFKSFEMVRFPFSGRRALPSRNLFFNDLLETLHNAAGTVEDRYTNGPDREHRWWPQIESRYAFLGKRAVELSAKDRYIPPEGRYLASGLRTTALITSLPFYLKFINRNVKGTDERVQAAHDLTHLLTAWSSMHFIEFRSTHLPFHFLNAKAVKTDNDRYRIQYGSRRYWRWVFPRRNNLPNAKLKCPAHVMTDPESGDTNLNLLIHASINKAAEGYDYF